VIQCWFMIIIKQIFVFRRFKKIKKKKDSQLRHVCLSVRQRTTNQFPLQEFWLNFIFEYISKICWENSSFVIIWQGNQVLYAKITKHLWSYPAKFFSDESCRENQNTHFMSNNFFPPKIVCCLRDNAKKKYCTAGQDTDDSKTNTHCMLDIQGYKHPLRVCNTYCFPLQEWLKELAPLLRYTYTACLLKTYEYEYS